MQQKLLRRRAEELAGYGYSRQHVFETLRLEHPEVKPTKVADLVRYIPSLAAREHFKPYHQALLACIIGFALLQLLKPLIADEVELDTNWRTLRLFPIATIFLGIAVYRYRGEVLQWLAFINGIQVFALIADLNELTNGRVEPWSFAQHALCVAIAALAAYLLVKMYPKYRSEKDPLGNMPARVVFPPEPGMHMM